MLRTQAHKIARMRKITKQTGNVEIYNAATLALERLMDKAALQLKDSLKRLDRKIKK